MSDLENALYYRKELSLAEEKIRLIKLQGELVRSIEADLENDDLTEWEESDLIWNRDELVTMCCQIDYDLEKFKDYINFRHTQRT